MHRILAASLALVLLGSSPQPAMPAGARTALTRYLDALRAGRYDDAYGLLARAERAYFKTPANFASVFAADRFQLDRYNLHDVEPGAGMLVDVGEEVRFLDQAHQRIVSAKVSALYGLTSEDGGYRIHDEARAWKAFDPPGSAATQDKLTVTVRKVSFYPGRVQLVLTFANLGDSFVTLLPYGRSALRDEAGHPYRLIETKLPELTDRQLRLGVRLAASAEYTGALTFAAPAGAGPARTLALAVGPLLRDGADQPFALQFDPIGVPPN
jgi:hypothetical protein